MLRGDTVGKDSVASDLRSALHYRDQEIADALSDIMSKAGGDAAKMRVQLEGLVTELRGRL